MQFTRLLDFLIHFKSIYCVLSLQTRVCQEMNTTTTKEGPLGLSFRCGSRGGDVVAVFGFGSSQEAIKNEGFLSM